MNYHVTFIALVLAGAPPSDDVVRWDSPSKAYLLIVKPGRHDNEWNRDSAKNATATLYRLDDEEKYVKRNEFRMENAVEPAEVVVSDDGRFIATLDESYNQGIGPNSLVIYGGDGRLRGKFSLEQLVPKNIRARMNVGNLGYSIDGVFICRPAVFWNERAYSNDGGKSLIVELNSSQQQPRRAVRIDLSKEKLAPEIVASPSAGIPVEVKHQASPAPIGPIPPPVRPGR